MIKSWQHICEILQKTVNPGQFQVWINPLQAELREEDRILRLKAPNAFVASWVRDRVLDSISQAAVSVLGYKPEIQIEVDTALSSRPVPLPLNVNGSPGTAGARGDQQLGLPILPVPKEEWRRSWRFTFDDFIVGQSNELAYVAAKSVAAQSFESGQLFMSSTPGLGKTHLMHALGRLISENSNIQQPRVLYLTGEEFASQMVMALKGKIIQQFKERFRQNVDLLLLEDVHFFQGKQRMQDELLATLKALKDKGAKVVMTSSFLPREMKDLDEQLESRFRSGFLAVIDRPDLETRRVILESKARKQYKVELPDNVVNLLASRISSDIRQLESCLQNLVFEARMLKRQINETLALRVLANYITEQPEYDLGRIVQFICKTYDLSPDQLKSKSRKQQVVLARNVAFYLARKHTELSLKEIGQHFNRNHSTVIKGVTNVERELSAETPLGRQLAQNMEFLNRFDNAGSSGLIA